MKNNNHKEILITCRRTAQSCMKHLRQKAIQVIIIVTKIVRNMFYFNIQL